MTSSLASVDVPAWDTSIITLKNDSRSVPDDWDNDDPGEESAKDIWDRANAAVPMPQIQISSQSTHVPPVAAITPSMRILQRPKATSSSSSANQTPTSTKSLQEREADYKAARERIFAGSGGGGSAGSSREGSPAPKRGILSRGRGNNHGGNGHRKASPPEGSNGPGIAREPHGAQEGRGFAPRGRRGRGGRGGSSQ